MLAGYITQVTRTVSAFAVGWVVTFLLNHFAIHVPQTTQDWLTATLVFGIGTGYYVLASLLERKWPKLSVLLGSLQRPTYSTAGQPSVSSALAELAAASPATPPAESGLSTPAASIIFQLPGASS